MEKKDRNRRVLKSYTDLEIYKNLYKAMLIVMKDIIPALPKSEKFDLASQMRRACKAPPARIAEAWAKRYQKRQWNKDLDDTLGECYEMQNHLDVCIDLYSDYVNKKTCNKLKELYEVSCKQIYNLKKNWKNYHSERK